MIKDSAYSWEKVKFQPVKLCEIFPLVYIEQWKVYIGIDPFSQKSFIKTRVANNLKLQIQKKKNVLHINGFGSQSNDVHSVSSHYCLLKVGQKSVELNLVPKIAANLPAVNINIKDIWSELANEKLSCPFPRPQCNVDILLGLNTFMKCIKEEGKSYGKILFHESGLSAISSPHGYIIVGECQPPLTQTITNCTCMPVIAECSVADTKQTAADENFEFVPITYSQSHSLNEILNKYFSLESYGLYNACNQDEESILDKFAVNTFKKDYKIVNNRFHVPLLRKPTEEYPRVSSNLYPALNRHKAL